MFPRHQVTNVSAAIICHAVSETIGPSISVLGIWLGSSLRVSPIQLNCGGWHFFSATLAILVMHDLLAYLLHFAQHKIPFLWAMHSFHHSDVNLDATTAVRIFWLEPIMFGLVFMPIGLFFPASGAVLFVVFIVTWGYPFYSHAGTKTNFGGFWWALVSPLFHRIHHSRRAEHFDKNFATLLPIWDLLFRTHYIPGSHEFPPTGLHGEPDAPWWVGIIWPFRKLLRSRMPV